MVDGRQKGSSVFHVYSKRDFQVKPGVQTVARLARGRARWTRRRSVTVSFSMRRALVASAGDAWAILKRGKNDEEFRRVEGGVQARGARGGR